jgi:hypothetical protein
VVADDDTCNATATRLKDAGFPALVMVVPLVCSGLILVVTSLVVFCVLRSEMRKLRAVEEAAFKVMDAVLRALLPDKLAEHLGCGIDNLAPEPDNPDQPPANNPAPDNPPPSNTK